MRNKSFLNLLLLTFSLCLASCVPAFGQAGDEAVPASPENSTTIVISQAYGGGGGTGFYQFDYVELKNISGAVQSLNGLSLIYGSATGQFGSVATNSADGAAGGGGRVFNTGPGTRARSG